MSLAPGWYDDNATVGVVRWFDGRDWTAHTAPAPGQVATGYPAPGYSAPGYAVPPGYSAPGYPAHGGPGYGAAPTYAGQPPGYDYTGGFRPQGQSSDELGPGGVLHWIVPVGRSWQSVLAGYVGLVALFIWILGPVAIALGVLGLHQARSGGHGSGRSVFALVAGGLASLAGILFLVTGLTS